MKIGEIVRRWWYGDTKPYDIPEVIGFHTERHWTADAAHKAWNFYLKNWQWIIATIIAIVGVIATL